MRIQHLSLLLLMIFSLGASASPDNFRKAKKLSAKVYADHQTTFYCGCRYEGKKLDLNSCDYTPRKRPQRAERLEWEHVVPASALGYTLPCWRTGGRKACRGNHQFDQMEAEMVGLVPSSGEVNGDRSNYSFGMIPGEPRAYGACDVEVDFKNRRVEPRETVRGDIARIYWFMADRYGLRISRQDQSLFAAWNKSDPVDAWECERNRRIEKVQGYANHHVAAQCN